MSVSQRRERELHQQLDRERERAEVKEHFHTEFSTLKCRSPSLNIMLGTSFANSGAYESPEGGD